MPSMMICEPTYRMSCSSVPCSSSLPPLPREPMTRSAWPALIGATMRRDVVRIVRSVGVDEDDDLAGRLVERQAQRVALALARGRG